MNEDATYQALTGAVMARIAGQRRSRARIWAAVHGGLLLAALAGLVPALQYAFASAAQSGFSEYLSLVVSDGGSLFSYWKEFALIVAESAPVLAGAVVVGVLMVLAYAARGIAGDIGRLRVAAL